MLDELQIEISETADGKHDYVQIRSTAAAPVNIVLIAKYISVIDHRHRVHPRRPPRRDRRRTT